MSGQKLQSFLRFGHGSEYHFCHILLVKQVTTASPDPKGRELDLLSMEGIANNFWPFLIDHISHITQYLYLPGPATMSFLLFLQSHRLLISPLLSSFLFLKYTSYVPIWSLFICCSFAWNSFALFTLCFI